MIFTGDIKANRNSETRNDDDDDIASFAFKYNNHSYKCSVA